MEADFENTDDRPPRDWKSRYEEEARKQIRYEAVYLGSLFFLLPSLILALWLGCFRFGVAAEKYSTLCRYGFAWFAGTLGGTMFSIKWLYHAVARAFWNHDRRLWRFFCPHLSGGLSFAFYTLAISGLVRTIDVTTLRRPAAIVACSFLVGYFSDSAIGKLREIAEILFATRRELKVSDRESQILQKSRPIPLESEKQESEAIQLGQPPSIPQRTSPESASLG